MFKIFIFLFYSFLYSQNPFESYNKVDGYSIDIPKKYYYEIYWGIINVGSALIEVDSVVEISSGVYAYKIVSKARSNSFIDNLFKVRDINISLLDVSLSRSYGYYKEINEGRHIFSEYTVYDYKKKRFYGKKIKNNKIKEYDGELNFNVFDPLSSLFLYIKGILNPDKNNSIKIATSQLREFEVISHKTEKIKTKYGKYKSYKLEPRLGDDGIFIPKKGRSFFVYISKDERLPVKLVAEVFIGSVSAELIKIEK